MEKESRGIDQSVLSSTSPADSGLEKNLDCVSFNLLFETEFASAEI